jgi:hypothetical protein
MFSRNILPVGLLLALFSCQENDTPAPVALEAKIASNIPAPQTGGQGQPVGGPFTTFSFATGGTVTDGSWDIAFRGSSIIVNGGTKIGITDEPERTGNAAVAMLSTTFESVTALPAASAFLQDGAGVYAIPTGSGNGWYAYNPLTNIISPIAGRVFVVKTHNGKYAKFEILSYYKNAPAAPDATSEGRYYTFRYVYQPNGTQF